MAGTRPLTGRTDGGPNRLVLRAGAIGHGDDETRCGASIFLLRRNTNWAEAVFAKKHGRHRCGQMCRHWSTQLRHIIPALRDQISNTIKGLIVDNFVDIYCRNVGIQLPYTQKRLG